jgi:hypothetical protein
LSVNFEVRELPTLNLITVVVIVIAVAAVVVSWPFARWYMGDEPSSIIDPKVLAGIRHKSKLRDIQDRPEWEIVRKRLVSISVEAAALATGVTNNKSLVASWLRPPSARWRGSTVPDRQWWPALEALATPPTSKH